MAGEVAAFVGKPKLTPLRVPWMVSRSTPYLRLAAFESAADEPTHVTFAAMYKYAYDYVASRTARAVVVVGAPTPFHQTAGETPAPYRLIRVTFQAAPYSRMLPSFRDSQVIDEDAYDWSDVAGAYRDGEAADEFVQRQRASWAATGICPDPSAYEVAPSPWLDDLRRERRGAVGAYRHYLVVGQDAYVEVLARDWSWQEGQVLEGW